MNDNLRVFCLIITLLIVAVSVGSFAIVILYEAAVAKDRSHLSQVADGLAQGCRRGSGWNSGVA
jgi:hypothetical protein